MGGPWAWHLPQNLALRKRGSQDFSVCGLFGLVMKTASQRQTQQSPSGHELYTLAPVQAPSESLPSAQPVWIRLPKAGSLCQYTGLSRSGMNQLILGSNAPVKSISLRKRYAVRGTRLIHLESLLAYLEAVADSQRGSQPWEGGE